MSLKKKTVSGVKWTTISTIGVNILQLIQLAILARLLDPSAFGVMAIVMVIVGFSQAFLDMGISNAIIHKQEITQEQLSTLYWVNVIAGVLIFVVMCGVAPFVASFYHQTELTNLIILLGTTFLIQPFGQQFMVLWQKELRFKEIARIDIINKFITLIVTVWFAYDGYGVYSLVYGAIAGSIVQTAQFMQLGFKEHKPRLIFNLSNIKEFLNFGAYQMGERTINYFNYQIDAILIGKLLGMEALGIYNIAKNLIMKPAMVFNPIITKVTFPVMAKIQNDVLRLKEVYLKTMNYLSSVNFLAYAFIFIFAHDIVLLLFGMKWLPAVPIVKILSVWGALRSTGNPVGSLLLAKGKANWGFFWNLGLFFYVPSGIYIGSYWGLEGVSWGLVILAFSLIIPNWYFLVRPLCGSGFMEYHIQILKPALIANLTVAGAYIAIFNLDFGAIKFLTGTVVGIILAFPLIWLFNREFLVELKSMMDL